MADYLPLGPNREWDSPVPEGKTFAPNELPDPLVYVITPGFIRAMGIRLHGREFTWEDGPHSERVVLINASAARIYWPNEDAVGKVSPYRPQRPLVESRVGSESVGRSEGLMRNETALKFDEIFAASTENPAFEKHYRIGDLARLWGLGRETVRKLVKDEPGVIKIRMGRKKAHTMYSVPESAAHRIHTRLLNTA